MADLLDIAPSTAVEVVRIGEHRIKVRGLSADVIAACVARFPELLSFADGSLGEAMLPRLIAGAGAAVGPIIAAGCGHPGDEAYEKRAATLLPEQQIKLLRAIFGLTFPNGFALFIAELTRLFGGEEGKVVKVRLKTLASPSPLSSDQALPPTMQ